MTFEELREAMMADTPVTYGTNRAARYTLLRVGWREPQGEALVLMLSEQRPARAVWEIGSKLVPVRRAQ